MPLKAKDASDVFALRRDPTPSLVMIVPVAVVTIGLAIESIALHLRFPLTVLVLWLPAAAWVYIVGRYRISWQDGVIVQRASGKAEVSISVDKITMIREETSTVSTLVSLRRPFRRITIYSGDAPQSGKFIDVSLKHFVKDDIRALMRVIHQRRPDLTIPKPWS